MLSFRREFQAGLVAFTLVFCDRVAQGQIQNTQVGWMSIERASSQSQPALANPMQVQAQEEEASVAGPGGTCVLCPSITAPSCTTPTLNALPNCFATVSEEACTLSGGRFLGSGSTCEPAPWGGCCFAEGCDVACRETCEAINGLYLGDGTECGSPGTECSGACCVLGDACVR